MFSNLRINVKVIISLLLLGIIPLVAVGLMSIISFKNSMYEESFNKLEAIRQIKENQINNYFKKKRSELETYGSNSAVRQAGERFIKAFEEEGINAEQWNKWKEYHGPKLAKFIEALEYYDLFYISNNGDVVYTVAEEADLGQNLVSGNLQNSGLGQVFQKAQNGFAFVDFSWYDISNEPAAFIAMPLNDLQNNQIGVLALQLSSASINSIMQERSGMGETGETYLVGSDKRMRSDSYLDPQGHSLLMSFKGTVEQNGVDTEAVNEALGGNTDKDIITDYNGNPVFSSYSPIDVYGTKWVILAEIDQAEVNKPINKTRNIILLLSLIALVIIIITSLSISKNIKNGISNVIELINNLIKSVSSGKLDQRANVNDATVDFRKIIENLNTLIDTFVAPLNVTAEYVDRISKGDIPPKITDDYQGDFNEIKNNLNQAIDVMNGLLEEVNGLIISTKDGKLDARANASRFVGGWSDLLAGINDLNDAFVGPINVTAEYVDRISKGDIPPKIVDEYKGDFNEIKNNLNQAIDVMNGLLQEVNGQIGKIQEGKLDARANSSKFVGGWSELVEGINGLSDAFIAPLNVTAEYVDRISKGDLPPKITDEYKGDFNEIKNNLNLCIDSIQSMINDANSLSDHVMHARLRERADETKHNGDFRKIIMGMNSNLDQIVNLLDNIQIPIMGIDKDFNIIYMNELGAKLDAKNPKSLEGTKCFNHFKTSDCNTENCACKKAMVTNGAATSETDAHPGGLDLEIQYSGFPIKDENGEILGAFEIVIDQTEVKNQIKKSQSAQEETNKQMLVSDKISNFQKVESEKIINILQLIASGNIDNSYSCNEDDQDLEAARKNFSAISQALNQTTDAIKQLTADAESLAKEAADGNLKYRANESTHHGEYKNIIKGVNNTLDNVIKPLNETADVLKTMSTGDLTVRIKSDYKGDFVRLKSSVNDLGESLSDLINQVNDTVSTTASSAVEISSTAESLAAASQEQSAQADEVASAVEQMSRTVTENAMSANKTSEMAQDNSLVATEGGKVVQQTVQKMRDIAKVVENSAGNIGKLGESSKQIGEIISVIDDIADQTNLLALNAAIEAARAGEQGRGFAVVADEVRKLAERTTDATKQIAGMIKGIQSETEQAVVAMNKGNEEVQSGIELADRAGQSLESILSSTQEVLDMINQIAAASEEQSATSEQISKNVVSISKVTADSTRRIEDVAHTSEDLAKLTEHLSELMSQFKVSSEPQNSYKQISSKQRHQLESRF